MALPAAISKILRFLLRCISAVFGDFRLSLYDPVMQIIPVEELYRDILVVALLAFASRLAVLLFMTIVVSG
jgi:hypothetical protein